MSTEITQNRDILQIFCMIFAKQIGAWQCIETVCNKMILSYKRENSFMLDILLFSPLLKYLSKIYKTKMMVYCGDFKVYNFDWVSLQRRLSVADKPRNDGGYLYYVVSVNIFKSSPVISQTFKERMLTIDNIWQVSNNVHGCIFFRKR